MPEIEQATAAPGEKRNTRRFLIDGKPYRIEEVSEDGDVVILRRVGYRVIPSDK